MKVEFANRKPSIYELCRLCGGTMGGRYEDEALSTSVNSVCTDSREASSGGAFIAICGDRVDGHNYVATAATQGCVCAICTRLPDNSFDFPIILVDDMLAALGRLGSEYSKTTKALRIGVSGSVGKTTTKEFIAAVLSSFGKVWKTEGNFNSVIGLPLSLLTIGDDRDYAVIEMGMNKQGEMRSLSLTAQPDMAVLTTIGTSHIEYFGTRENIAKEKLDITSGLKSDGFLFLSAGEPLLAKEWKVRKNVRYFSSDDQISDYYALNVRTDASGCTFDAFLRGKIIYDLEIPVIGKHNVAAALAAIAIAYELDLDEDGIRRGLASYRAVSLRQQMMEIGGRHIICDCYNASPESMRAASLVLDTVGSLKGGRRFALLGDMLELGDESPRLHYEVGQCFGTQNVDGVIAFGPRAEEIYKGAADILGYDKVYHYPDISDATAVAEKIAELTRPEDTLLIKASRLIAAERVAKELEIIFKR